MRLVSACGRRAASEHMITAHAGGVGWHGWNGVMGGGVVRVQNSLLPPCTLHHEIFGRIPFDCFFLVVVVVVVVVVGTRSISGTLRV